MSLTVREWRRLREISQEDMAQRLNVHVNTFQKWEKDSGKIPFSKAVEIAKILDVAIDEISFVEQEAIV